MGGINELMAWLEANFPTAVAVITGSGLTITGVWTVAKTLVSKITAKARESKETLKKLKFVNTYIEPLTTQLGVDVKAVDTAIQSRVSAVEKILSDKIKTTCETIETAIDKVDSYAKEVESLTLQLEAYMQTVMASTGDTAMLLTYESKKAELIKMRATLANTVADLNGAETANILPVEVETVKQTLPSEETVTEEIEKAEKAVSAVEETVEEVKRIYM